VSALEEYRKFATGVPRRNIFGVEDVERGVALADAAIAELEASLADESARVEEFRSTLAETRKQRDAILARAEQAESHAADCKRLVTACENDLDAERMKRRELETETARYEHLYEAERRVRIAMDKRAEQAEAEVARLRKLFGMAERGTE
jgi:chromosome segregation ATPase